jgi:hypothetical protein
MMLKATRTPKKESPMKAKVKAKTKTWKEWLAIWADLDGHLSRGGSLLDAQLPSSKPSVLMQHIIADTLGTELCARLSRFFSALGSMGPADTQVGMVMTEDQVRAIWRLSADPDARSESVHLH